MEFRDRVYKTMEKRKDYSIYYSKFSRNGRKSYLLGGRLEVEVTRG